MIETVLTPASAAALGITRHGIAHRLATARWQWLLPGVYLTHAGTPQFTELAAGALAYAGAGATLSGTAALQQYAVRAAPERCTRMLVLVPLDNGCRSAGFVHVRRTHLAPRPIHLGGVALAPLPRAVVDTCLGLQSRNTVRAIVAEVVQRNRCSVLDISQELARSARRGSLFLRAALNEVGHGAWSGPECHAGDLLRRAAVPAFEQNVDVHDDRGQWLACGDLVWRQLRAILEVDSRTHHADPAAWERTLVRHNALAAAGWAVLHYPPQVILADPEGFVRQVEQWLIRRGHELLGPNTGDDHGPVPVGPVMISAFGRFWPVKGHDHR